MNPSHLNLLVFLVRILEALLLGCLIGAERQRHHRMAGLRTNALVATGAGLFVAVAELVPGLNKEGARIAAQVVSGIGFLGAGVIMRDGFNIRGLNTAATLWCSSAIGVLAGLGLFAEAAVGAAAIVGSNLLLPLLAEKVDKIEGVDDNDIVYALRIVCSEEAAPEIRTRFSARLTELGFHQQELRSTVSQERSVEILAYVGTLPESTDRLEAALAWTSREKAVTAVGWKVADEHR